MNILVHYSTIKYSMYKYQQWMRYDDDNEQ